MEENELNVLIKQIDELSLVPKIKAVLSIVNGKIKEIESKDTYSKAEVDAKLKALETKMKVNVTKTLKK